MSDRYDTSTNPEGQYQPGSGERVLLNRLGISIASEMDQIELELLVKLAEVLFSEVEQGQVLSAENLCEWHRRWLGNVYNWAGSYRSVNMGKGDFQFATAGLIPGLMKQFEEGFLVPMACYEGMDDGALIEALAVVHIEFVLIHPFRDGNGRLARLLAVVMALQAGRPVLDFSWLDKHRELYFSAIHSGLDDAAPMKQLFRQVLLDSGTYS